MCLLPQYEKYTEKQKTSARMWKRRGASRGEPRRESAEPPAARRWARAPCRRGWLLLIAEEAPGSEGWPSLSSRTPGLSQSPNAPVPALAISNQPFPLTHFLYFSFPSPSLCKILSWVLSVPIRNTKQNKNLIKQKVFLSYKSSV